MSAKSAQDAKLAAFKANKLLKKHARAEEMHRQFPSLYGKPPAPGTKINDDRMAPSVKILLEKYPVPPPAAAVNDENAVPVENTADRSKNGRGKGKSLISKIFGGGVGSKKGKDKPPVLPKRQALSPKRDTDNILGGSDSNPQGVVKGETPPPTAASLDPLQPVEEETPAESPEEEQVQDVLDYLLGEKQVTPAVYRRMSCERLTMTGIRQRLSVMPSALPGAAPDTMVLEAVQQYIAQVQVSWDEDVAFYLAGSSSGSTGAAAEGAVTAADSSSNSSSTSAGDARREEAPLGHVDVSALKAALTEGPGDEDGVCVGGGKCRSNSNSNSSKVTLSELPPQAVSVLGSGAGRGGAGGNKPSLRVSTGAGGEEAAAGGGGEGSAGNDDNDKIFGGDDDEEDDSNTEVEDENDPSIQSHLLRKCLDWYLRQGAVSLDVASHVIRKADSHGTPRGDDIGDDGGDGKEFVAYEVRMGSSGRGGGGGPGSDPNSRGFKMMVLQRYSSFQRLHDRLRKALNEENIKNIAGGSAAESSYQASATHNSAFFDQMRANSYIISSTDNAGALRSKGGRWQLSLPPLPPKRILTSFGRWKDPVFLESRRDLLRSWLSAVLPLQAYQTPTGSAASGGAPGSPGSPSKRAGDNKIRQAFRSFLLPDHCL